jgi:hypothetical protein
MTDRVAAQISGVFRIGPFTDTILLAVADAASS